ncbi:DUF6279 family lipoprotein [Marichromatium bheemlicum]|uniref:Lipoprotein n=1 Tax=Marichromatium bheemlicum TaxID=365339 RepID=A0ABX1I8J3_9GAMM|nr:DUF6279 family lipoprotein [Marichromatium bheemlicum]NKN32466.1 hypothetical protein [Marichromatium bheemlicum]
MSRVRRPLVALACLFLAVGCSRISLVYDNAPFLTGVYVDHQLDLDPQQLRGWKPVLQTVQERHRREALPELVALLERLLQATATGPARSDLACLMAAAAPVYRHHAELFITAAAPLLAALTPPQRTRLEQRWHERETERGAPPDAARERQRRARRYIRNISDWTGPLTPEQQQLIGEITAAMPHSQPALDAYRAAQRRRLMTLLEEGAGERRIAAFLRAWLTDFDAMPIELRRDGERLTEQLVTLAARLGASLAPEQRARVQHRLGELRDTLRRLQRGHTTPRPLPCSS